MIDFSLSSACVNEYGDTMTANRFHPLTEGSKFSLEDFEYINDFAFVNEIYLSTDNGNATFSADSFSSSVNANNADTKSFFYMFCDKTNPRKWSFTFDVKFPAQVYGKLQFATQTTADLGHLTPNVVQLDIGVEDYYGNYKSIVRYLYNNTITYYGLSLTDARVRGSCDLNFTDYIKGFYINILVPSTDATVGTYRISFEPTAFLYDGSRVNSFDSSKGNSVENAHDSADKASNSIGSMKDSGIPTDIPSIDGLFNSSDFLRVSSFAVAFYELPILRYMTATSVSFGVLFFLLKKRG